MGDQVKKQEIERAEMDNNALLELLNEVDRNPRVLSSSEVAFLRGQLDRFDEALSKPHEDSTEYDDMNIKSDKIRMLLSKQTG